MKKSFRLFSTALMVMTLTVCAINDAQAKRLGGGSSFGSRQSYSMPYRPSAPSSQPAQPQRQQQNAQPNSQPNPAPQSSMGRGMLGGLLGGLAMGGLLGALFSGTGFHGFGLIDGLILALVVFFIFKLFARKRPQPASAYGRQQYDYDDYQSSPQQPASTANYQRPGAAGFNTDLLFGKQSAASGYGNSMQPQAINKPAGFDERQFLTLAEQNYRSLQAAWDRRDLGTLRQLCTDKVFAELQDQLRANRDNNQTDILQINMQLVDVREVGQALEATVLFDNRIVEDRFSQAQQVREVWHFIQVKNRVPAMWLLDGIQQLED